MRARLSDCTRSTAGLGGEAGHHRLVHLVGPAAVVREHHVGFEHLAVLAGVGDVAALQHDVEVGAQRVQRGVKALQLLLRIVGDQLGHDDARLVQHHMAEPDAVGDRQAFELERRWAAGSRPGLASAESSPDAMVSASTIAVVCSASSSSSE